MCLAAAPGVDIIIAPNAVQTLSYQSYLTRDTRGWSWRSDLSRHSDVNTWNISATQTTDASTQDTGQGGHQEIDDVQETIDIGWMNVNIFPTLQMYSCAFWTFWLCLEYPRILWDSIMHSKQVSLKYHGICFEYSLIPNWDIWGTDVSVWGVPRPWWWSSQANDRGGILIFVKWQGWNYGCNIREYWHHLVTDMCIINWCVSNKVDFNSRDTTRPGCCLVSR